MKNKNLSLLFPFLAGICAVNCYGMLKEKSLDQETFEKAFAEAKDHSARINVFYDEQNRSWKANFSASDQETFEKDFNEAEDHSGHLNVLRDEQNRLWKANFSASCGKSSEVTNSDRELASILFHQLDDYKYENITKIIHGYGSGQDLINQEITCSTNKTKEKQINDLVKKANELYASYFLTSVVKDRTKAYAAVQEMLAKEAGIPFKKSWFQGLKEKASSWSYNFSRCWSSLFSSKYQYLNNLQKKLARSEAEKLEQSNDFLKNLRATDSVNSKYEKEKWQFKGKIISEETFSYHLNKSTENKNG